MRNVTAFERSEKLNWVITNRYQVSKVQEDEK